MQEPPPPPGNEVPPPPSGSVPPAPVAPAEPTPPTARQGRQIAMLAVVGLLLLVIAAVAAVVSSGNGSDATSASPTSATSGPTPTPDPSPTSGEVQNLPDEIGGAQRLEGNSGDAIAGFMDGLTDGQIQAAAMYGTLQRPVYMYFVIGSSDGMGGLPLEEFLNLMAAGGRMQIAGGVGTRTTGDVEAACATTDDRNVGFICVTIDDSTVDALMGFEEVPVSQQLDLAIQAAG